MLFAEEFVLLALDPDGTPARGVINQPGAEISVTGALLSELVHQGHLSVDDDRIELADGRPDHPLLALALENTAPHDGKKLTSRLESITHAGWSEVIDHMIHNGVLGRDKPTLRPTRHPVTDPVAHAALLNEVRLAAQSTGPLTDRLATLLALSGPCQLLDVVAPDPAEHQRAKERIAVAAEQDPVATAVAATITAAVATATMTTTIGIKT